MSVIMKNHSGMAGYFMIEKCQIAPDGSEVEGSHEIVAPWQPNLITDSGLDNLASSRWMQRCRLGASNTPPNNSDTVLGSELGAVNISAPGPIQGPETEDYASVIGTYVFPPGTATGNIAEIGVSPVSGNLTTRSLIRDEEGNPTVITKGPIDQLTVTYQIREYPDKSESTYQVTNPHTSQIYDVVSRGLGGMGNRLLMWNNNGPVWFSSNRGFGVSNGPLVPFESTSTGGDGYTGTSVAPYVPGTHYLDRTCVWDEGVGNIAGGITRVGPNHFQTAFWLQASFDPPIDKDNTKTLRMVMRKTWGRYTP